MGEFTGEFKVANDLFGNFLVQTKNAFIIEWIKAMARCFSPANLLVSSLNTGLKQKLILLVINLMP